MKRREFVKNIGMITGAGIATFSVAGIPVKAFAKPFMNIQYTNGNILVIVQFKGGNDGINTVIPVDQYSLYQLYRPTIAVPENQILLLTNATGLNPSLQSLKPVYDEGKVTILQNIGYPNQNRSHFRSTDIWLSASDANTVVYDGWIGRYLVKAYPDYPNTPPEHPMAIQLGSVESNLFESQYGGLGIAFQDPNSFYQLVNGSSADNDPPPSTLAGDELKFLKQVAALSIEYSTVIKSVSDKGTHTADYPTNNNLAVQLKIVSNLIYGGLQTPVYLVTLDGFDTHADQVNRQTKLLVQFADAVSAFQKDLDANGMSNKVVLMTFSEFGRRVKENGSKGTDHGAALPIFVMGVNIKGGVFGPNASLSDLDGNGDIKFKYDFRQVYATMLRNHFGMSDTHVNDVLFNNFSSLDFLSQSTTGVGDNSQIPGDYVLNQNYPNPFNPSTKISYALPHSDNVQIKIYDMLGRKVATLVDSYQSAGSYTVDFDGSSFSSGTYFYALETGSERIVKKMMLVK